MHEIEFPDLDGVELSFRVEILRDAQSGRFRARLFRWELYELKIAFPDDELDASHESIPVLDSFWDWKDGDFATAEEALETVVGKISRQLSGE